MLSVLLGIPRIPLKNRLENRKWHKLTGVPSGLESQVESLGKAPDRTP